MIWLVLAMRKYTQPIVDDIGDKSIFMCDPCSCQILGMMTLDHRADYMNRLPCCRLRIFTRTHACLTLTNRAHFSNVQGESIAASGKGKGACKGQRPGRVISQMSVIRCSTVPLGQVLRLYQSIFLHCPGTGTQFGYSRHGDYIFIEQCSISTLLTAAACGVHDTDHHWSFDVRDTMCC
jgi:Uncharacterized integral membrane protein (DUF2301)